MTNPNNAVGTNGALNGRTSVNALNDVLACFSGRGILQGWAPQAGSAMTITIGGTEGVRDVAIAEDPNGNKTTINNISGAPVEVEIATASTEISRVDAVVAYVNNPANGNANQTDNPTAVGVIDVEGTASAQPTDSAIRAAITADGGTGTTAYYVILATVNVPQNATAVSDVEIGPSPMVTLAPDQVLYAQTGQNTDGAMTQKAATDAINEKLTKIQTAGSTRVYAISSDGTNGTRTVLQTLAEADSIPQRTSGGQIVVTDPTASNHTATKSYVDTGLAEKADTADVPVITVTTTDPGEGVALEANHFIAVVEE